ncbi:MAG: polymer-forming cytoskeletal protein [Candidatus Thermoplasmatota archaeon]
MTNEETAGAVKAQVTKKAVETDGLTYANVSPDQFCEEPLIPLKNPTQQMVWNVTIGKGAVYNPRTPAGIYANKVEINYGARVNGSIFGRERVTVDSGTSRAGPTFIYGNVTSNGHVLISAPVKTMKDYEEGVAVIIGNIVGKIIEINTPVVVKGNVLAEEDVKLENGVVVYGIVHSKGRIDAKDASAYTFISENRKRIAKSPGEDVDEVEPSGPAIHIGAGVSVFLPFIWLKESREKPVDDVLAIDGKVRYIDSKCADCAAQRGIREIMKCRQYLDGKCGDYTAMDKNDILAYQQGFMLSLAWRTSRDPEVEHKLRASIESDALAIMKMESKYIKSFMADEYGGFGTVEDMAPRVDQTIVYGDFVAGSKVDIHDSVVTGSQIGTTGDGRGDGGRVTVKDSVVKDTKLEGDVRAEDGIILDNVRRVVGGGPEPSQQEVINLYNALTAKMNALMQQGIDTTFIGECLTDAKQHIQGNNIRDAYGLLRNCMERVQNMKL